MAAQDLRFDLIAASPLVRAQETAAIIAESLGEKERLVTWKVLAPGGNTDTVCRMIGKHGELQFDPAGRPRTAALRAYQPDYHGR